MKFEPLKTPTVKERFVATLQDAILSGELPIGEKLPSEAELAAQMKISRSVVDGGLKILRAQGFVRSVPGKGIYVDDYIKHGNIETLNALMNYRGTQFSNDQIQSILEIRKGAQWYVVKQAIQYATDEELDQLGHILAELSASRTFEQAAERAFDFWHQLSIYSRDIIVPLAVNSFHDPVTTLWVAFCRRYGIDTLVDNTKTLYTYLCQRDTERACNFTVENLDRSISGDRPIY